MGIIDADAHVIEIDQTWEYMDPSERHYKPGTAYQTLESGEVMKYWIIDGRAIRTAWPGGGPRGEFGVFIGNVALPTESKFMLDVQARIAHMDELGTDLQVLFPSMWTSPITNNPAEEVAICRSYNRWMADIYAEGKGRFRWAAVIPVLAMDEVESQLRFAKDNGAVAVNLRGVEVGSRLINDPYFYPLYEWAAELDMPICPHSGTGSFELDAIFGTPATAFERNKFSGLSAFHTLLMSGLPKRFPNTKWGIIEFSADWIPYMLNDIERRLERRGGQLSANPLTENNVWVTIQLNDDIEQVHRYVGGDRLVIGTDYGHADSATEVYALRTFENDNRMPAESRSRVLWDNPKELYAISAREDAIIGTPHKGSYEHTLDDSPALSRVSSLGVTQEPIRTYTSALLCAIA